MLGSNNDDMIKEKRLAAKCQFRGCNINPAVLTPAPNYFRYVYMAISQLILMDKCIMLVHGVSHRLPVGSHLPPVVEG